MRSSLLLAAMAVLLSACANFSATVSSTGSLTNEGGGETVHVAASGEDLAKSLFFQRSRDVIEAAFRERGYVVVGPDANPSLVAVADYQISDRQTKRESTATVGVGIGTGIRIGGIFFGLERPLGSRDVETFGREVRLIVQRARGSDEPERVYEGRATSRGKCGNIEEVAHHMFTALFEKFPNGGGTVRIEAEINC